MFSSKKVAAAIAAVLSLAGGVVVSQPAQASPASRHCGTKADYRRVHYGQPRWRVNRILHSRGTLIASAQSAGYRSELRHYQPCWPYGVLSVTFSGPVGGVLFEMTKANLAT